MWFLGMTGRVTLRWFPVRKTNALSVVVPANSPLWDNDDVVCRASAQAGSDPYPSLPVLGGPSCGNNCYSFTLGVDQRSLGVEYNRRECARPLKCQVYAVQVRAS
jgi:hypothetical protein